MDLNKKQLIKVALCGHANSGKNTVASLISDEICDHKQEYKILAFADPIKEMIMKMFPGVDIDCLFGNSELRNEIIPDAVNQNGNPLTYRQSLIDIGTLGRKYNKNLWVNNLDNRLTQIDDDVIIGRSLIIKKLIIISDVRFLEEWEYLKSKGFFLIKILRNSISKINDASETAQDAISLDKFDFILENNSTLEDLQKNVKLLITQMKKHQ